MVLKVFHEIWIAVINDVNGQNQSQTTIILQYHKISGTDNFLFAKYIGHFGIIDIVG